jgi:hypothetical protein
VFQLYWPIIDVVREMIVIAAWFPKRSPTCGMMIIEIMIVFYLDIKNHDAEQRDMYTSAQSYFYSN